MSLFHRKKVEYMGLDEAQARLEEVEEHIHENARVLEIYVEDPWTRNILKSLRS